MPGFVRDANGVWVFDGALIGDAAVALNQNAQTLSSFIGGPVLPTLTDLSIAGTQVGGLARYGLSVRMWTGSSWRRVGSPFTG